MKNLQYAKSGALIMEFNKKGFLVFQNTEVPAQLSQLFEIHNFTMIPTARSYNIILSKNKNFFEKIQEFLTNIEQGKRPILTFRDSCQNFVFDIIAKKNEKSSKLIGFTLIVYVSLTSESHMYESIFYFPLKFLGLRDMEIVITS